MGAIVERHKALCKLKEVLVRLKRTKVSGELKSRVWFDGLYLGSYLEWICYPLLGYLVEDLKQSPTDINRKGELVGNCQLPGFTDSSDVGEVEVQEVSIDLDVSLNLSYVQEHLLVQDHLAGVIDWNLLINFQVHTGEVVRLIVC